jgi:hypothetical protein
VLILKSGIFKVANPIFAPESKTYKIFFAAAHSYWGFENMPMKLQVKNFVLAFESSSGFLGKYFSFPYALNKKIWVNAESQFFFAKNFARND